MRLSPELLQSFSAGRFEDFLEDGAAQVKRFFPRRFEGFDDSETADNAARNVVGLSYETACELGRRSGLLAMRIAFLRAAFGIGVLDDPRHGKAVNLVNAQIKPAAIKPNTSIGTYLAEARPIWDGPPFERQRAGLAPLLEAMSVRDIGWNAILDHLEHSHADAATGIVRADLQAFVNASYSHATMLGLTSLSTVQLHTLVADGLGLFFFDDPLLPDWGTLYRTGEEASVSVALHDILAGEAA